ncbi:MAG: Flp family type IVb pilin [Siculibacillus sp.]
MEDPQIGTSSGSKRLLRALLRDESGATAIEYALLTLFIFLAVVASIGSTGSNLGGRWSNMANNAANAMRTY